MAWAKKLEVRLETQNWSAVSRACGRPAGWLSQMLGGEHVPNAIDAVRLCRFLGTTVEEIFGGDADLPPRRAEKKTALSATLASRARKAKQTG